MFADGGDYSSYWTFNRPENAVKRFIENNYQISPNRLKFDELIKQPELDITINEIN